MGFHEYISKPFKEVQVFNCLNTLLDVEFICDDNEVSSEKLSIQEILDLSQFSIREDLYARMKDAAEMCHITDLEKKIKALQDNNVSEELVDSLK
jgi:hypothetical protein